MTAMIAYWGELLRDAYGDEMPVNYLAFDCETTGTEPYEDLPVEIGHTIVRDCQPIQQGSFILDWTRGRHIKKAWLQRKLGEVGAAMEEKGEPWRLTFEYVREHGRDPCYVLDFYRRLFLKSRANKYLFIGHNAWNFDAPLLESTFQFILRKRFEFERNELFDTGVMEKAIQMDPPQPPHPGESMKDYFLRIRELRLRGIRWAMAYCIEKYGFVERFGIDPSQTHQAGVDSHCCHLLYEEHRSKDQGRVR